MGAVLGISAVVRSQSPYSLAMRMLASLAAGVMAVAGCISLAPHAAADDLACTPRSPCNFLSPSGNIGCSLENGAAPGTQGSAPLAYCGTVSPPQSVVLEQDGSPSFFPCSNDTDPRCLTGLTPDTPTLAYGQTARQGPFTCVSEETGVTCTVPSGRGVTVSRSGIVAVG